MGKPKGKTPSLLSMTTGTPAAYVCARATKCDRCDEQILKGDKCFQIPKQKGGFTARPIFCVGCTIDIIEKTKADVIAIEAVAKQCG